MTIMNHQILLQFLSIFDLSKLALFVYGLIDWLAFKFGVLRGGAHINFYFSQK